MKHTRMYIHILHVVSCSLIAGCITTSAQAMLRLGMPSLSKPGITGSPTKTSSPEGAQALQKLEQLEKQRAAIEQKRQALEQKSDALRAEELAVKKQELATQEALYKAEKAKHKKELKKIEEQIEDISGRRMNTSDMILSDGLKESVKEFDRLARERDRENRELTKQQGEDEAKKFQFYLGGKLMEELASVYAQDAANRHQLARQRQQERAALEQQNIEHKAEFDQQLAEQKAEFDKALQKERIKKEAAQTRESMKLAHTQNMEKWELIGKGLTAFVEDPNKIMWTVGGLSALAAGVYGARQSTKVIGDVVAAHLLKPKLVRVTSRLTLTDFAQAPVATTAKALQKARQRWNIRKETAINLSGIVLPAGVERPIVVTASTLRNIKKRDGVFPHALYYGKPGTGKTLVARRLAEASGMDFALMSGDDLKKLPKEEAIQQLRTTFRWFKTSKNGVLGVLDECEGAVPNRENSTTMSEGTHATLTALLDELGTPSKNFAVIGITNVGAEDKKRLAQVIDKAFLSRIDDHLYFPLPGLADRNAQIKLKIQEHIVDKNNKATTFLSRLLRQKKYIVATTHLTDEKIAEIAERTEGFSGRQLEKLVLGFLNAAIASDSGELTPDIIESVLARRIEQHKNGEDQFDA